MKRALALLLLVAACTSDGGTTAASSPTVTAGVPTSASATAEPGSVTVVATGLRTPWGLAFLPDGDALVSERDSARIFRVPAAGGRPTEVMRLPETEPGGEGGLLGIAVSPSYDEDGLVYAYLTAEDDNRIVRFTLGGTPQPILTGIPKAGNHNGGRLAFGPDGNLYAGTGDAGERSLSQDPESLGGKILRMTPEGKPVGGSLVFSMGHRNVQGLAFDQQSRLWATEFGQNQYDEVNLVTEGGNYGWPEVEGKGDGGGRFAEPLVVWRTSEASPSGAAIVGDNLYVAALRGERLWRVPLGGGSPTALFRERYGRLRTVAVAPDGALWVTTSNRDGRGDPARDDDRILRVTPG